MQRTLTINRFQAAATSHITEHTGCRLPMQQKLDAKEEVRHNMRS